MLNQLLKTLTEEPQKQYTKSVQQNNRGKGMMSVEKFEEKSKMFA
jgi:hypothetical protein